MTKMTKAAIADHLSQLDQHGYTVLENVIPNGLLTELKAALAQIEGEHHIGYRDTAFEGTRTTRIYNLLAYHPAFAKIPIFDGILRLMEKILDPGLQLSSLSAICPGPGQEPQPLHSDSQMIPLPRLRGLNTQSPMICGGSFRTWHTKSLRKRLTGGRFR